MITKPSSGKWGKWTPEEEAETELRKAELYSAWRENEISMAKSYLNGARGTSAWQERLDEIQERYGKRFADDVKLRG